MHFLLSVYYELTASTCFKYYVLIIRRHCIYNNLYILCAVCRLAASRVGVELHSHPGSSQPYIRIDCLYKKDAEKTEIKPHKWRRQNLGTSVKVTRLLVK
jgi:hypothetical protein